MKRIELPKVNNQNLTVDELFASYVKRKTADNIAKESLEFYRDCFKRFTGFFPKDGLCKEISQDTIDDYISYLRDSSPNIKGVSINSYLRGIRAFLYYGMEKGCVAPFTIKMIKVVEEVKEPFTDTEIAILLIKPNVEKCSFTEYRNWVMSNYLIGTGNRLGTVVGIKNKDVDFDLRRVLLRETKNKRQYYIPLSNALVTILTEYMQYRQGDDEDYLFCTEVGKQFTKSGLQTTFVKYHKKKGVKCTSIHRYRHTFAKGFILNGGGEMQLQSLLGHSDPNMSRKYVKLYAQDIGQGYELLNPLDTYRKAFIGEKIRMNSKLGD
ncbi:MAG: tyrosine-type recombinase/integrase [Oscillospiraceae bacterium]|jgi:integrase/recombinase XerD|nr:tyrosine-type recombinase/integrase [Oscillospiraceae bacterium]